MSAEAAREPERQEIDLEVYYVRYGPMVLRRCRKMLRDEQSAFDAMQEVFVKLLVHKDRLDGRYPSSLLYTIATNHCLNRLRDERRRGETVRLPLDGEIAGRPLEDPEAKLRGLLDPILKEEREDTRRMAYLYFIDGLSLEKIALEMDMSVAGIHKRLRKLRRLQPRQGSET
jgi:RNA polymerase sigma-70 factor (ECF subfamily)